MQVDAVIAFFILGALSVFSGAKIKFPKGLYESISMFLMIAIGLKGGIALQSHASFELVIQSFIVISMGVALPFIAYPILRYFGKIDRVNAASVAAHYGSVSVGTYAVAVAVLEAAEIPYEAYFPLFVVLLEIPAILVGIALAKGLFSGKSEFKLDKEIFVNQSIFLMVGGLFIGMFGGQSVDKIMPLFKTLFPGFLALFLLEMGMVAAARIKEFKNDSAFLAGFAILMPLIGGAAGILVASVLDLSAGGMTLMATLGASASYIAVPAAMRTCLPEANPALSISASLGVTFPFNVVVGVPVFVAVSQWLQ